MNRKELIEKIAKDCEITKTQATAAVSSFTSAIQASLKKKNSVTLVGFGTFEINRRKARKGRNPGTGEVISIKAQNVVRFRVGKALKEAVNK